MASIHNHPAGGGDVPSHKSESSGSRIRRNNGVGGNTDLNTHNVLSARSNVRDSDSFTTVLLPSRGTVEPFNFRRGKPRRIQWPN